jgi:DNA gyrase subunit B
MILEKVAGASRTRISARAHKDIQRRKNALESSSLPTKLSDCRSDDTDRTELYIVEGDSALGTAKAARNSEFQANLADSRKDLERSESFTFADAREQ